MLYLSKRWKFDIDLNKTYITSCVLALLFYNLNNDVNIHLLKFFYIKATCRFFMKKRYAQFEVNISLKYNAKYVINFMFIPHISLYVDHYTMSKNTSFSKILPKTKNIKSDVTKHYMVLLLIISTEFLVNT